MKKIFLLLVAMVTFLPCLFAEHIKFAVNGPEKRYNQIGITVPDEIGAFSYVVSYKNYPLFDIIEVSLFDEESPIGKEF